ncbi:WD-40 repeat family protein [Musa troglodytarum]|uniref:WD-40 repeat family protein n=1 Tax=Musa troglodytarum TaxID=320322 RepID=A0A9E7JQH5_9LILI|nr:WD-40 repeat family protein [Musa troglodytarum]
MRAEFPVLSQNLRYLWLEYYESIVGLGFDEGFSFLVQLQRKRLKCLMRCRDADESCASGP